MILPTTAAQVAAYFAQAADARKNSSVEALVALNHGDPEPLAAILRDRKPLQPFVRDELAKIITGEKRLKRAHGNTKLTATQRHQLRCAVHSYHAARERRDPDAAIFKRLVIAHVADACGADFDHVGDLWKDYLRFHRAVAKMVPTMTRRGANPEK